LIHQKLVFKHKIFLNTLEIQIKAFRMKHINKRFSHIKKNIVRTVKKSTIKKEKNSLINKKATKVNRRFKRRTYHNDIYVRKLDAF